ncbi:hypothetical protein NDU88_010367 [Pleurodeles waltl]|uniref:Uncharacterized protein n=1 Tax=Pleurodeles waltl TaxID=8319 RepID=A0AAV7PXQ0_PLEWA|nr:hypothetical protein NDU88_010367 [Pleurodeles waltl]
MTRSRRWVAPAGLEQCVCFHRLNGGEARFRFVSVRVLAPEAEHCHAVLPKGSRADPVFGSMWLGQLQAAEACILCFRVTVSCRQHHGEAGTVAVMCRIWPGCCPILCLLTLVASLVWRNSLAEDVVIRDAVDKKEDVSPKKAYSGTHLALRAGIHGTNVAQSLLSDLKALNSALDGSSDCSGLMSLIERQVEFLSDISFDVVWASALAEGGVCVCAQESCSQGLENRCGTKSFSIATPFKGNVLFGAELEEKLHKL